MEEGMGGEAPAGGEEAHEEIEAEESEEPREPKKIHDPALPSQAEVDAHMLTHVPFRSWCEHCV